MTQDLTHSLLSITTYPIRYMSIPKCGCTYVKNLLWVLEMGAPFPDPKRIHDVDEGFARASELGLTTDQILGEEFAFTIWRDPVHRFYSLYTDKVIGDGYKTYVPLRATLAEKYGLNLDAQSAQDHSENCAILIDWLDENLRSQRDLYKEAHWTPQFYRNYVARAVNLKVLLVDDVTRQLEILLAPVIPNIAEVLTGLERNKSAQHFPRAEVITPALEDRVNTVYARDRLLFDRAKQAWTAEPDMTSAGIPRVLGIIPA